MLNSIDRSRVLESLEALERELYNTHIASNPPVSIAVAGGDAGIALFYGYYFMLTGNPVHHARCINLIERMLDFASENKVVYTYCNGITGLAWVIKHFVDIGLLGQDEYDLSEYDDFIGKIGLAEIRRGNYDFLHGGVGCGIYLSGRQNTGQILNEHLIALMNCSEVDSTGRFWYDKPSNTEENPDLPRVNFGLAHGVPSIICLLAKMQQGPMGRPEIKVYLQEVVDYLYKNADTNNYVGSYFPSYHHRRIDPNRMKQKSRLAWCYGDLGVVCSLLQASQALNNERLSDDVVSMALESIRRTKREETMIIDGGLCHGLAGVAHLYNRLFISTGRSPFQEAANFWARELLAYIDHGGGITQFLEFNGIQKKYSPTDGFLTGSAGASLALISIIEPKIAPHWDSYLLIS